MACVSLYLQKTFLFLSLLLPFASIVAEESLSHVAINSTNGAHATSAQKHNVIQQKKRRMSHPIHTWFSLYVNNHFTRVKVDAETKLTSDQRVVKELFHALDHIEQCSTPGQYIALLERLRSAYDKATHDGHEAYVDKEVHESVRCALLLKISATLSNKARKVILDLLYTLDEQFAYWQDQQNHSTRYFFHKSPHKWFIGKEQQDEIRSNIEMLETAQEVHYRFLGALTSHLHTFNINASNNEQYQWITNLLAIISELLGQDTMHHEEGTDRFDVIAECMQQNFGTVFSYKKQVMSNLSEAKKPNHFVRNWMKYAFLMGSALYIRNFWNNNPEVVDAWVGEDARGQYKESIQNFLQLNVIDPVKDTWKVIFKKGSNNPTNERSEIQRTMKGQEAFARELKEGMDDDMYEMASNTLELAKKMDIESTRRAMQRLLEKEVGENKLSATEMEKMLVAERENGDFKLFQEHLNKSPKYFWSDFVRQDQVANGTLILLQLTMFHCGLEPLQDLVQIIIKQGKSLNAKLTQAIIFVVVTLANINGKLLDYDILKEQQRVNLNLALLTPAIFAGWCSYKGVSTLYSWMTKRDYAAIRQALAHVYTILIESAHNVDDTDYGKLIYLLHNLKQTAKRHITRKNNMHREFEADILKLESADDFTPAEKRLIIDNMRAHYPFLMCVAQ